MEQTHNQGAASGEVIFAKNTEFNRFGLITAIVLIVGCTGGLAVGLGGVASTLSLILIVIPTMTTLSSVLAVAPMRFVMASGIISASVNTFMIAYYLIT